MREERWTEDDVCRGCGHHYSRHRVEGQGRRVCPVVREEKTTPPQERNRSPRGDY